MGISIMGILILAVIIVIAVIVMLVYKTAYNRHANKVLAGVESKKMWLSPIWVLIICLAAEVLLFFVLSGITQRSNVYTQDGTTLTFLSEEEAKGTIYETYNGSPYAGFRLCETQDGYFHVYNYENDGSVDVGLPANVLVVDYNGPKDMEYVYMEVLFYNAAGAKIGNGAGELHTNRYYIIIDEIDSNVEMVELHINLFDEKPTESFTSEEEKNRAITDSLLMNIR